MSHVILISKVPKAAVKKKDKIERQYKSLAQERVETQNARAALALQNLQQRPQSSTGSQDQQILDESSSIVNTTLEDNEQQDTSTIDKSDVTMRLPTPDPEVVAAINSNTGSTA